MTKERWDNLSQKERRQAVLKLGGRSLQDPRWVQLMADMIRPYGLLTPLQQDVVKELP